MVGAIDYTAGGDADVTDIDDLENGETKYPPNDDLYVKEFIKSGYTSANSASSLESTVYDRAEFSKDGSLLTSNTPQVLKDGNAYATPSTKLAEVADTSKGTLDTSDDTLSGTSFNFEGVDIHGNTYNATIDLSNSGSTFSVGGNTYDIFNMQNPREAVDADEMTYQQLMDVMNMVVTDTLPASNSANDYDAAILDSSYKGTTQLSYDGKLQFEDSNHGTSRASIALYDSVSDDFNQNADGSYNSSVMTFNSNNALTISDPKTDFFSTFDDIIKSVENYKTYPDSESGDMRNVGMENALQMLSDLQSHVGRSQSSVGSQSNSLENSLERSQMLEMSTMSLRSDTIDTDLAEASLNLTQLNTTYEAMLSTVGKVSQLSLVNYL
jgi:flagellar hook-associated protein 3 FlgL